MKKITSAFVILFLLLIFSIVVGIKIIFKPDLDDFLSGREKGFWKNYSKKTGQIYGAGIPVNTEEKEGLMVFWQQQNNGFRAMGMVKDGKRNGIWNQWHFNGYICSQISYKNGIFDGIHLYWHPNGQKESEGRYLNGQKDGIWIYWNKEGEIIQEELYEQGKLIKKLNDFPSGDWQAIKPC